MSGRLPDFEKHYQPILERRRNFRLTSRQYRRGKPNPQRPKESHVLCTQCPDHPHSVALFQDDVATLI